MQHTYALIMAGGAGTRLWPLSREKRPKPLLPLLSDTQSMFEISVERLLPLLPPERILVVASAELSHSLHEQVPALPVENFIVEPTARDTAPAIGLGALHIHQRDPQAVMMVLTADHFIADTALFREVLKAACAVAQQGHIATLGIQPTFPSTGFGYLEQGSLSQSIDSISVYDLVRFIEKPPAEVARQLYDSGRHTWNSGMFIWQARRALAEFERHAPDIAEKLSRIGRAIQTSDYETVLQSEWADLRKISIDYALMEHIEEGVYVIPASIGWSDIGNFEALYDILSAEQGSDHALVGHEPVLLDSQRMLVYSPKLVATIGLQDLVIIDTEDVLLICPRDRAQEVKQLVDILKQKKQTRYL
jgi:mannose-1-phosphate guanylyltransferase